MTEITRLARERGCILRVLLDDRGTMYWVENDHFIGKPFGCLDDLRTFLQILPSTWEMQPS